MGAHFTKDKAIDIYVTLDDDYYLPGGTVKGNVYLDAKMPT